MPHLDALGLRCCHMLYLHVLLCKYEVQDAFAGSSDQHRAYVGFNIDSGGALGDIK